MDALDSEGELRSWSALHKQRLKIEESRILKKINNMKNKFCFIFLFPYLTN